MAAYGHLWDFLGFQIQASPMAASGCLCLPMVPGGNGSLLDPCQLAVCHAVPMAGQLVVLLACFFFPCVQRKHDSARSLAQWVRWATPAGFADIVETCGETFTPGKVHL